MTVFCGIKGDQVVCLHVRRPTTPDVGYPVIVSPSLKRLAFHRTTNQSCYLDRTQKHSAFCKEVSDHEKKSPHGKQSKTVVLDEILDSTLLIPDCRY